MNLLWNRKVQRLALSVMAALLIGLLSACSIPGVGSTAAPTATPAPTATATPALSTYTGTGYTISYPQDWKQTGSGGQVTFQDALGINQLSIIYVANPGGAIQPATVVDATL